MPVDREQGNFKVEIPAADIAEAVAAVEKHEGTASGASTTSAGADYAQRERQGASTTAGSDDGRRDREPEPAPADERERDSERDLRDLRAQLSEERDLRLRALADLDNFRKRVAREREQLQRAGAEELMRDLLPVLDNMDRALGALPDGPLGLGVSMTQRHLEDTLKRHGLKPFSVTPGTVFDPRVHEAITTVPSSEHPAGTVVDQALRGYLLHDRLLRPASVVVASVPSVEPEGAAGAGAGATDGDGSD